MGTRYLRRVKVRVSLIPASFCERRDPWNLYSAPGSWDMILRLIPASFCERRDPWNLYSAPGSWDMILRRRDLLAPTRLCLTLWLFKSQSQAHDSITARKTTKTICCLGKDDSWTIYFYRSSRCFDFSDLTNRSKNPKTPFGVHGR